MMVLRIVPALAALCTIAALAGCSGGASHKADPYCPAVVHILPKSAPQDYNTALNDMTQLTTTIPSGKDHALATRILAVERSLEAIGKADIGLGQADASQLAAYYTSASHLRAYCNGRQRARTGRPVGRV
jgi:hypothetical protein